MEISLDEENKKFDIEEFLKLFIAINITNNKYSFYKNALIKYIGLCKYNLNSELLHDIKIESSCDKEDGNLNFTSDDYEEALEKLKSMNYLYTIKPERDTKIYISENIPVTRLIQERNQYMEEMLEFIRIYSKYEDSYNLLHIIPLTFSEEDEEQFDIIKKENDIDDDNVALRLWSLRLDINEKKDAIMDYKGLIKFLKSAMNWDEMQIWSLKQQAQGIELTLDDKLKKFFELKTDEDILQLYDLEQNYNKKNIASIRKTLNDDLEEDSDLHLGLIEEDEEDMKDYNMAKVLKKRNIKKIFDDDIED